MKSEHTVQPANDRLLRGPLFDYELDMRVFPRELFGVVVDVCSEVGG